VGQGVGQGNGVQNGLNSPQGLANLLMGGTSLQGLSVLQNVLP
jgi:hypothetical protein